jgi:gas vesicle protein
MNGNGKGSDMLMGFVVGSVLGAAVGAGIALLYAPQSGKESRDWVARRTRELKDRVAGAYQQTQEAVRDAAIPS